MVPWSHGPEDPSSCGPSVLIIKLSALGDLVRALPTIRSLKQGIRARIHWVVQGEYAQLVHCFTDVERVISFPRRSFLRDGSDFLRDLRRDSYDYIIDLQGLLKSAAVAWSARGARRIGPSFHREGAHRFYSELAGPRQSGRHAVEEMLDVIRYLGLPPVIEFPISLPAHVLETARPRVALVPRGRWMSKNWPPGHFAEVARTLREERGVNVYLVGGPADRPACNQIEQAAGPGVINTAGRTTVLEMAELLNEMDLVVGVDSGPLHVAAALGVPVLALYGPTDPACVGPYGEGNRVITAERTACWPCRKRDCADCIAAMRAIPPERVAEAALEMLK
ncbi:MAG: glycosyltransferase family 9 protein [Kiritimatiellae bacterium]|nr:glycosyltransferase family 9 protein [Kiritimatiellia bacterium]